MWPAQVSSNAVYEYEHNLTDNEYFMGGVKDSPRMRVTTPDHDIKNYSFLLQTQEVVDGRNL